MRQSEEKYRLLVENIQEGVFIIQDGKFQYINETFARIAGYNVGEVIGRDFKDFVAPEDLKMVTDRYSRRQAGENVPSEYEFHLMRKDGERIIVNMSVGIITYGGRIASMGILKDISEQKRMEKALEDAVVKLVEEKNKSNAIIAALGDGIIIQDTDYKIIYQNKVQNDLFGNHVGEYCYKVYEGRDTICEWCPVEMTLRDGKIHRTEREVNTGNGLSCYELISSPLRDSTGKIVAGIKVVRDITGLKRKEEELRKGERFLASIFESIQDGIGIIDKDMNILRVNPTAEKWYPHTNIFVGRKCYEVYHGRSERCEVCPAWKTFQTGESAHEIVSKHGADGKEIGWLEIYSFPMIDTATREMTGVIEYVRDITERRRMENELKESEEKYRVLFEASPVGIGIADLEGKVLDCNVNMQEMTGLTLEELKSVGVGATYVDPDERKILLKTLQETGRVRDLEIRLKHKDGTIYYALITADLLELSGHDVLLTTSRDITERKRIERVLLESEERYRNLFENSPISLWEEDCSDLKKYIDNLKGKGIKNLKKYFDKHPKELALCASMIKVVDVNKATINLFKAKTKGDFIDGLEKIFTESSYEIFKNELVAISENKTSYESEDVAKTLTGDKIHISLKWVLTPGSERTYSKRLVSIVDITERKQAEEELNQRAQLAMLGAEVGIALTQNDALPQILQRCTEALVKNLDAALARIWTLNQPENVLELKASAGIYTHLDGSHSRIPLGSFKIGLIAEERKPHLTNKVIGDPRIHDHEWARQEGIVAFAGYPLIVEERLVGVVAMFARKPLSDFALKALESVADIIALGIERKQVEEAMKRYALELEESNRIKELFTDIMHHDILNPLNTANGFIELLKETETISMKKAYLETIERSLVKGMELIDSAMKYSMFESLESIELEELDLKNIVEEVIEALTPLADNAGLEIVNRITLNTTVKANKIIEEVFSNLISNAIKYSSTGKRIIVESENKGESLQVRVIDFGEGIKDKDKTIIFERFRRGGKTGVKGSGLGLAIAGRVMELHKGRIWIEDNPEGGSVFIVEIPGNLN